MHPHHEKLIFGENIFYTGKVRLLKSGESAASISLDGLSKFADYLKVLIYNMLLLFMFVEKYVLIHGLHNYLHTYLLLVFYITIQTMVTISLDAGEGLF